MLPLATALPRGAERHASRLGEHIMDGDAGLIAAAAANPICLWCETEFEPRKGGSPQRFCNSKHRDAFHSAGRRYAEHAVLSGQLTVADVRNGPAEACTLLTASERSLDYTGHRVGRKRSQRGPAGVYTKGAARIVDRARRQSRPLQARLARSRYCARCWSRW